MVGGIVSSLTGLVCAGILERCACAFVCCFGSFVQVICDNLVYNSPASLQVRKDRSLTAHDLYELEAAHDRSERGGGEGELQINIAIVCFACSRFARRILLVVFIHVIIVIVIATAIIILVVHLAIKSRLKLVLINYPLRCCALLLCCVCCAVRY